MRATESNPLEVWAGLECTVNRVGDRYSDQLKKTGHDARDECDLERLAALGVRSVRYPVLWERHAADPGEWKRTDRRLNKLRRLGVRPIVGLVHHGSGPPHTSLLEESFVEGLAAFAGEVAARYSWIEAYTPVNEPLTTARFSALYGHWYPHARSDQAFVRTFLIQIRAIVAAMAAIREVRPDAQLIQTEDLGRISSSRCLAYQARFENERRWLTWDLLNGVLDERSDVARYLIASGASKKELRSVQSAPCPPDVLGVNHYVTSERYLDRRLFRYPVEMHGGNGRHRYVDIETVRAAPRRFGGPYRVLRDAWRRYRSPIAVTEAHLGCTREEQLRWLNEVWLSARRLKEQGADIRAVTTWSAFGACDWDSLVTRDSGGYESGAFDIRSPVPRETAVAGLVRDFAAGRAPDHPALDMPGWWRREAGAETASGARESDQRRVLIVGDGPLSLAFVAACQSRGLACERIDHRSTDLSSRDSVEAFLARRRYWLVVNASGYKNVEAAERDPDPCRRANLRWPLLLAASCADREIKLVTFSTELVFDGRASEPYTESDVSRPLGAFGRIQAEADEALLTGFAGAIVVRSGLAYGPREVLDFVGRTLRSLRRGRTVFAADDLRTSPTYRPDLVNATLDLAIDGEAGLWHLAGSDALSWAEMARATAAHAGVDASELVVAMSRFALGWHAPRPAFSALASRRHRALSPLARHLSDYAIEAPEA